MRVEAGHSLANYFAGIGDPHKTIDEMVGDLQRIWCHAAAGFTIEQDVPVPVMAAYNRLVCRVRPEAPALTVLPLSERTRLRKLIVVHVRRN